MFLLGAACSRQGHAAPGTPPGSLFRGGARVAALVFPSAGCPCRYAPLVEALKANGPGEGSAVACTLAAPPSPKANGPGEGSAVACTLAAPPSPGPGDGLGVPFFWDSTVQALKSRYGAGGEGLPLLVVLRRGPGLSVLLAAKVPEAPARQKQLAALVSALAEEEESTP
ncbi:MAG: hypothetical protein ACP5VN_07575 [Acidobacteriota bacterium]